MFRRTKRPVCLRHRSRSAQPPPTLCADGAEAVSLEIGRLSHNVPRGQPDKPPDYFGSVPPSRARQFVESRNDLYVSRHGT